MKQLQNFENRENGEATLSYRFDHAAQLRNPLRFWPAERSLSEVP